MSDGDLLAHLKDILNCCGVPAGQANTAAADRLRLAVNMAVAEERERCAKAVEEACDRECYYDSCGRYDAVDAIRGVTSPAGG